MKIRNLVIIFLILILLIGLYLPVSYALSKYGSRGEEVKKIQTKLKQWGYYSGNIDGIYGTGTFNAVKSFQKKNGLDVDGIAGEKTLKALGITSGSNNSNSATSNNTDLNLLSRVVYGEARGEPYKGMVAVAASVLNRVGREVTLASVEIGATIGAGMVKTGVEATACVANIAIKELNHKELMKGDNVQNLMKTIKTTFKKQETAKLSRGFGAL